MHTFVLDTPQGTVTYTDKKRWLWFLSLANPLIPLVGIAGHIATGNELWLLLPLTLMFVMSPLLDLALGEDENNPPEVLVPQLEEDNYYRILTYLTVPLHFLTFFFGCHMGRNPEPDVVGFPCTSRGDWVRRRLRY